jgi:hypothetical protein
VFRRRRSGNDDAGEWDGSDAQDLDTQHLDEGVTNGPEPRAGGGPWDAGEPFPQRERVDLGSLQVPFSPDYEIQLVMAEQHGAWVTARHGESELQMQAFASSRSDTLWEDVRAEIVAEVQAAGGSSIESDGPFGISLTAQVPAEPGQPDSGLRTVRFVGVDGPRWFLRGLFSGPAAGGPADSGSADSGSADSDSAAVLEDVFRHVVVSRGEHPVPPRDLLELRLPPDAQQALEEQQAAAAAEAEENRFRGDLNPFERGPEFTETR